MKKRPSIQKQITLNVILPVGAAILLIAFLNYYNTNRILKDAEETKNNMISLQIKSLIEFQDNTLQLIDENMDNPMREVSYKLVTQYFSNTDSIEKVDLQEILLEENLNPKLWDIYILNKQGIVISTTAEKDLGLNFFEFGEKFKEFLLGVMQSGSFVSERLGDEKNTGRKRKFSYQGSRDGNYVIELGVYSENADQLVKEIKEQLNEIAENDPSIISVDLFVGEENPISFNSDRTLMEKNKALFYQALESKGDAKKLDPSTNHVYEFYFMERSNSDLYSNSVIRIISDRTNQISQVRKELLILLLIFGITMVLLLWIIFQRSRQITTPLKNLAEKVTRITEGNLEERAEVEGNIEISTLSTKFNVMLERLEESYNDLEQKVIERTQEISQQKEEIEAQRDSLAKSNFQLEKAFREIEEQKERIEDSIRYAKRIQNVILPPKEFVEGLFPNSFILYKPKDIVSGDFYWVAKYEGKYCIAAVDCTGHGVPGAFMSLVGYTSLNETLQARKGMTAANILEELNGSVISMLRQKKDEGEAVNDGMDVALLMYDPKKKMVQYAGAYRPIYVISKGELREVKGDKKPIGRFFEGQGKEFTNAEFKVAEQDSVFIFSDGYCDQFGGTDGKKYLPSRFKKTLLSIWSEPLEKQEAFLDKAFEEWKGGLEQIDDVLVIGLKF